MRSTVNWKQARNLRICSGGPYYDKLRKDHSWKRGRVELHDQLKLTGAEVSINQLPAGAGVPFVHSHTNNEEIYGILAGKGKAILTARKSTSQQVTG